MSRGTDGQFKDVRQSVGYIMVNGKVQRRCDVSSSTGPVFGPWAPSE